MKRAPDLGQSSEAPSIPAIVCGASASGASSACCRKLARCREAMSAMNVGNDSKVRISAVVALLWCHDVIVSTSPKKVRRMAKPGNLRKACWALSLAV